MLPAVATVRPSGASRRAAAQTASVRRWTAGGMVPTAGLLGGAACDVGRAAVAAAGQPGAYRQEDGVRGARGALPGVGHRHLFEAAFEEGALDVVRRGGGGT